MNRSGHGSKYGRKREQAIVALLNQRSIEEAAKSVGISAKTLMRWMKDAEFDEAYRATRRSAFGQAIARLQQASGAAVTTVVKVMIDPNVSAATRLRAADIILERTAQGIEAEDFGARISRLERCAEQARAASEPKR
jgi:hypothetical protein